MKPSSRFAASLTAFVLSACTNAAEFKLPNHTFTLPDGFVIEQVAGPPLANRPISADFDELGRLYVTDSSGLSDRADKQLQLKPHRIVRLEDTNGDGRFDKSIVFADKMMFPEGILWHDGAIYCSAPPSIWKLEDTDGDGVADRRTEWHEGKTLTGCANDLHGPYLGPDGWIYWCKGAFAKQTYERPGLPTISDSAAHIFRCRPDHTDFESVMSGGMDNPVEIAFSPEGESFFTTTFFVNPEAGKRDALVHCIYGAVYPKVHGVLDGLKRTGDLLPPLTQLGPAVPSAILRYASRVFGDEFQDNLFSAQFNLRKIQRHILEPAGATFRTRDIDFLVSDNPDFHPTDILEDADGSLLVLDTGGWYKICCPTSQIAKPEVLGTIYRIRRVGTPKIADPRGLKLRWNQLKPAALANLLDDKRPVVRERAISQLAKKGAESITTLKRILEGGMRAPESKSISARRASTKNRPLPASVEARRNAVWALTRIDTPAARDVVRFALADENPSIRQTAVHSVSLHRDAKALAKLIEILKTDSPHLRRNAAAALGRIGDKSAATALLAAVDELGQQANAASHESPNKIISSDLFRVMEHSLIYALIEIDDRQAPRHALEGGSQLPYRRRAALIALDQMDGGELKPKDVIPHLNSSDPVLRETASWIVGHHSEWGGELADFFRQRLTQGELSKTDLADLQVQLVQFTRDGAIQRLIVEAARNSKSSLSIREFLLRVMAKAPLKEMPAIWRANLRDCLSDSNEAILREAVAAVRALPVAKTNAAEIAEPLLILARNDKAAPSLKLDALAAVPGPQFAIDPPVFEFLRTHLDTGTAPLERTTAASVLGRARMDDSQLLSLTESVKTAGPMELSKLLSAFENRTNETIGLQLVAALKKSKGLAGLRAEVLKPLLAKYGSNVQETGEELYRLLNAGLAEQKAHLEQLQLGLSGGDRDRGRRVFESSKTACSSCHQVGYLGGRVGPDLTRIGAIRTERDLLEAIVYPSAGFVRSYEPMIVRVKDGEEYSGVLRQESADTIVIVGGPTSEQRVALADVTEMRPGTLSIMPQGIDQQLTKQELADLIAFLRSLK